MLGKLRYDRPNLLRIRSTMEGGDPPQAVLNDRQQKETAEQSWRRNSENHFRGGLRRNDASTGSIEEFRSEKHHPSGQPSSTGNGASASVHAMDRNAETLWVYRTLGSAAVSAPASWSDIQNLIDEQLVSREEMEVCRVGEHSFVPYVSALAARTSRLAPQPVSIDDIEGLMGEARSPKKELPRVSSVDAVPAPQMLPQAILPPEPLLPNAAFDKQERAPQQAPSAVVVAPIDKAPAPTAADAQPAQSRRQSKQSKAKAAPPKAVEPAPAVATTATAQSAAAPTAWGGKGVAPKQEKVDIEALIVEEKRAQEARSKEDEQERLRVAAEKPAKKKSKAEVESQKALDKNFPALESIANEGNSKRARKG